MVKITKTFIEKLKKTPVNVLKELSEDDIATIIQKANYSYYNSDEPLFSDNLYDLIKEYLEEINPKHPILKNVGSTTDAGKKEELPFYMGSLDKIKADEKALDKYKKDYKGTYIVSDKLDGNSALIHYKKGEMKLYSRGDGTVGQDISHLIPFIKTIKDIDLNKEVAIRGELIISRDDFQKVKDKGANARNMIAGVINSKIPDMEIAKYAQFVAYELIAPKLEPERQFKYIKALGFKVVNYEKVTENKLSVDELSKILVNRRDKSEFEIDGIVIFHNEIHKRLKNENPKYAFAFKSVLTMQKAEVIVTNVEWNLSKDGYLIPVINFNGVNLAGVTIKRAHGFNGKFINDNKIGPGSKIIIMRSGDVIPYVTEILTSSESGEPQMPEGKFIWTETGVDIKIDLVEQKESDELKFKNIAYFFDKIDIKGLSSGNLRKIYDSGKKTVKDILNCTIQDLLKVDGFKIKMAEKVYNAIQERKSSLDCLTVMDASNTLGRGIGKKKVELIIESIPSILQNRYIPTLAEMLAIKGVETKTASLFINNLPKYFEFIDINEINCTNPINNESQPELYSEMGVNKEIVKGKEVYTPDMMFKNKKFVFTGFRNTDLEKKIKSLGGTVTTSVSKTTTAVVRKDSSEKESTKVKKAEELGIEVINLDDFIKKFKL